MTASLGLMVLLLTGGLRGEVEDFLSYQARQGLDVHSVRLLRLDLLRPCSLAVPPLRGDLEGYLAAFGGNHTLDLWISIADTSWAVSDSLPDDVPVLRLTPKLLREADMVVLEALDMTHGASSDSAAVMWLLRPVDRSGGGLNL
jgi:hypothetical protein